MLSLNSPTPLTAEDVEVLSTTIEAHMARNSTFHKQASIRIVRVTEVIGDLDQRIIPEVVMQGQYGVLHPELANHLIQKLQQFADDVNDLGDTLQLLSLEYNSLSGELKKFMIRIKGKA